MAAQPGRVQEALKTSDFDYHLPKELIAQKPIEPRDASRLLVLDRSGGSMQHRRFNELGAFLKAGDLLVLNDSRVIPARLHARRPTTHGAVELLLLRRLKPGVWQALARPARRLRPGSRLEIEGDEAGCEAQIIARDNAGSVTVRFSDESVIEHRGQTPLPPYITEPLADPERYQTVYARERGSAAAPTAGLHFTSESLARLRERGIGVAFVTLHVGLDTFRPVDEDEPAQHRIHGEHALLPKDAAQRINETRAKGGRVVAVGTTSVRVLETAALSATEGIVAPYAGWTELFIVPGHHFRAVDAIVTNFHLPRSTLLMLVSAFAGRDLVLRTYAEAVAERYRFYSFGDAMLMM